MHEDHCGVELYQIFESALTIKMVIKCKRAPYSSLFFIGFFSGLAEVNPTEVTAKGWKNFKLTYSFLQLNEYETAQSKLIPLMPTLESGINISP